jgi:phytol kinase
MADPLTQLSKGWLPLVITIAACLALLVAIELLSRQGRLKMEAGRKLAHVGGGIIMLPSAWLFQSHWPLLVMAVLFTGMLLAAKRMKLLVPLHPSPSRTLGTVVYPVGIYLAYLLSQGEVPTYLIAILIMTLADTAAAVVGGRFGTTGWIICGSVRTPQGSLAFALVALMVTAGVLGFAGGLPGWQTLALAGTISAALSIVEALSPNGLDNLTVPVAAALFINAFFGAT